MLKRNLFRDLLVYMITSIRFLLLKGRLNLFFSDLSYFNKWRKYRLSSQGTIDHRVPWLVFSCIDFLDEWLKKDMQVFEYGSGGSTLYFAEKVGRIISIEHDAKWFGYARTVIEQAGFDNIHYQLIEPVAAEESRNKDCTIPENYVSCFAEYQGFDFSTYASSIDRHANELFDLVVVDGRVRHSCIAHALKKVKLNGALLLDNADRVYYLKPFPQLMDARKWKEIDFTGHFPFSPASVVNSTKVFIKIA